MVMGAPVVYPLNNPLLKIGRSSSLRGVVPFCIPPLRRSRSGKKSSAGNGIPAGQPSIFTPTLSPWDSPKILIRNSLPNEFIIALPVFSGLRKNRDTIYLLLLLLLSSPDHPPSMRQQHKPSRCDDHDGYEQLLP